MLDNGFVLTREQSAAVKVADGHVFIDDARREQIDKLLEPMGWTLDDVLARCPRPHFDPDRIQIMRDVAADPETLAAVAAAASAGFAKQDRGTGLGGD